MTTDEDLTRLVQNRLAERAGAFTPVQPSWDRIETGLRAVRRRRRLRAAGAVGVVLAIAAGGAIAADLPPFRGPQRASAPPDGGRPVVSSVFGATTVGSLADDMGFLASVREAVADLPRSGEGALPGDYDAADVAVPFAGDVTGTRVVLVEVPVRTSTEGVVTEHVWFSGARGADARTMTRDPSARSEQAASVVAWTWVPSPGSRPAPRGTGALVVLSAVRGDVEVATGRSYGRDGTVSWSVRTVERASPGHWELAVPWTQEGGAVAYVRPPGASGWAPLAAAEVAVDPATLTAGALPAVHGSQAPTGDLASAAFVRAQQLAGLPVATSTRRLLWSGTTPTGDIDVVAVTAPSGAHVVTVGTTRPLSPPQTGVHTVSAVLPAGPLEDAALAWVSGDGGVGGPTEVALLGPVGATSALVVGAAGNRVRVPLTDGFGATRVVDPRRAEFADPGGTVVARVDVALQSANLGPPPG